MNQRTGCLAVEGESVEGLLVDQRDDRVFDRERKMASLGDGHWANARSTAELNVFGPEVFRDRLRACVPKPSLGSILTFALNIKQYLKVQLYLLGGATFEVSLSSLSLKFFPRAGTKRGIRLISALHACNAESLQGQPVDAHLFGGQWHRRPQAVVPNFIGPDRAS